MRQRQIKSLRKQCEHWRDEMRQHPEQWACGDLTLKVAGDVPGEVTDAEISREIKKISSNGLGKDIKSTIEGIVRSRKTTEGAM